MAFYGLNFAREGWRYEIDEEALAHLFEALGAEFARFGIGLKRVQESDTVVEVKGYGDLLNAIRLRSPADGFSNLCLGHVIGASANRDLCQDIRRGVNRIAFAPEMVEPEGSSKVVCHNCGCGC